MPEIETASIQTAICTQVLEHLPRPSQALKELSRVLRNGGCLILSVPHLSAIHEAPNDFYRYTRFGLDYLLGQAGLEVERVIESGGLISFLAHGASVGVLGTLGKVGWSRRLVWFFNYALLVRAMAPLDRLLGLKSVYPCNYVVLARKKP
jgi:SAM-dependent methyltransferase